CLLVNSFGLSLVAPASAGDFLVWLQVLVASEEVLDFILDVLLNVGDILVALGTWVIDDAQQLIVSASFIGHLEDAEDAGFNDNTWEDGLWQQHQCIQRVANFAQGVVNQAIRCWVSHWRKQVTIQVDLASFMIDLVFITRTMWDFNGYFNAHD